MAMAEVKAMAVKLPPAVLRLGRSPGVASGGSGRVPPAAESGLQQVCRSWGF